MTNAIKIPLSIGTGALQLSNNLENAVTESLELLLSTPLGCCAIDENYGFVFNNMAFENFNENDGTIFNTHPERDGFGEHFGLYNKKISGSSKNISTFAADLKGAIQKYEKRLEHPSVAMTYMREERSIHILIKGAIVELDKPYQHKFVYRLWR